MFWRALILTLFVLPTTAHTGEFNISPPTDTARMTMPCWERTQLSAALNVAQFDPVVRGLLAEQTDPSRSMATVWMHLLTGRSAVVITHATGEECLLVALTDAE